MFADLLASVQCESALYENELTRLFSHGEVIDSFCAAAIPKLRRAASVASKLVKLSVKSQ